MCSPAFVEAAGRARVAAASALRTAAILARTSSKLLKTADAAEPAGGLVAAGAVRRVALADDGGEAVPGGPTRGGLSRMAQAS